MTTSEVFICDHTGKEDKFFNLVEEKKKHNGTRGSDTD